MNDATPPAVDLATLPEEQLLDLRICDLPLAIEGTWLEKCVARLHHELQARGIVFQPQCYLADEWLTPEDEPVVGIPFYLAHPRLVELEKKMMLEAEGSTEAWCMQLLRHEAGHALSYAYGLHKKRSWKKVFGSSSAPYEDTYRYRPYSKSFVRHLDFYYAQYHPDEDFCETFAVWLTPGLDWRKQYRGWKALDKLVFVERLMSEIAGKPPPVHRGRPYWKAAKIRSTLRRFYKRRRFAAAENYPDFHDENLRRMFVQGRAHGATPRAVADVLVAYRRMLLMTVSGWTREKRFKVNEVFKAILQRARVLNLVTDDPEPVVVLQLATYVTTLLMNYRYTTSLRGRKPRE
ncbi:MAG: putative zinc-binding metallopeptidase [Nevskiaceae bacterium]